MGNSFTTTVASGHSVSTQTLLDAIKAALATNPMGVVSISVDGQTVQYSSAQQALDTWSDWKKRGIANSASARASRESIEYWICNF